MHSPNDSTKACTKCGETKPLDAFHRSKKSRDGHTWVCKDCDRARARAYAAANAGAARARVAAWRKANPEKARELNKAWHKANPERSKAHITKWRKANADTERARDRARYLANIEKERARSRARHTADPDRERARIARWREANPEKARELSARWNKAHPEECRRASRNSCATRRARVANAPAVERIDHAEIWQRDGGICHLCDQPCDPSNWHLDHVMPLSKGGTHTANNVAVSHPACNMRKHNKTPGELGSRD